MMTKTNAVDRRSWILGVLGSIALGASKPDHPELDKIRLRGREAGMEGFDESESPHYLGVGDAEARFREEALRVSEAVFTDFRKYFSDKKFALTEPKEKLVVVILAGPKSYAMFEGRILEASVGGHFDLDENRLVMFNFRGIGANPRAPVAEEDNTFVLVHEATHLLTFNTGLLDRRGDFPKCIAEGLATLAETWRPRNKGQFGSTNARRMKALAQAKKEGEPWIPIETLLADDDLFDAPKTEQLAYAESWMLVSKLMKDPARLPRFRDYLAAIRATPDKARRIEIATAALGNLEKLDREIRTSR